MKAMKAHARKQRSVHQPRSVDPTLNRIIMLLHHQPEKISYICQKSGVCRSTLYSWMNGRTKRPLGITMDFVLRVMGYHRPIIKRE